MEAICCRVVRFFCSVSCFSTYFKEDIWQLKRLDYRPSLIHWVYLGTFNQYIYSFRLYLIKVIGLFHFSLVDKCLCNTFLIHFLLYYRQMNKLNLASKREHNLFWIIWHVSLQREMYIFCQFRHEKLQSLFWHVLWELHRFRGVVLLSCKASLSQNKDSRGGLAGPPSADQTEWTLTWDEDLLFFTSIFSHVLVGCPWNGHRLCHCARNIVLSFMLLLLLLNYDMWLLFLVFIFWML